MTPRNDRARRTRRKRVEQSRPITEEKVDERLEATVRMFVDAAAGDERLTPKPGRSPSRQQVADEMFRSMRGYMSDELTIVSKLQGPDGIAPEERERQIARRGLAKLTKTELQDAAGSLGLMMGGTKDDLLDRLVVYFDGDTAAVSRLLNSMDRHTREGRRHAARLFPFETLGDTESLAETLAQYEQRYVRTDVASWFVVARLRHEEDGLNVDGEFRTYDVTVDPESLRAREQDSDVRLHIRDREPVLRAHSRHEAEAAAGVEAFAFLIQRPPLPSMAHVARSEPTWGSAGGLRIQTTWFIGVLLGLLDHPTMTLRDVTSASFERASHDRATALAPGVPHVGSARLRGQHVLDSQPACRHLASGERLRDVTAILRFQTANGTPANIPVRIAVDSAHVAVMTGFGGLGASESRPFHERLEDYVTEHLVEPRFDACGVERVVSEMLRRATQAEAPQVADLFARLGDARIRLE